MSAILFDLDGVLIDSWEAVESAFLAASTELSVDGAARLGDFRARMGMPLEAIVDQFGFPQAFPACFRHHARAHDHKTRAFPGVAAMLHAIRQSARIGVVTGKDRPRTLMLLESTGLARYVDAVVSASDAPGKPRPEGLWLCEQRLGAAALAFIGDTAIDLLAAHNAGRTAVLASWGGGPPVSARPGVIEIAAPGDVVALLRALDGEPQRQAAP
ncbi:MULTISPECIES: HAD-IA family hydrolase [Rhodopseudomonas]|uniref:phosphoglycolate phosphatase n=1 Tax=Rhodopseudomonas palustris TaxID=1076 RepID=A0A0D7EEB3_RHOPL|nr:MULTISPECIES: HAD-IA family hydrolase [Rhodopseudomonas]KIZ38835.1 hypothetical protein OO17_22410 [Rhodopseudomonas palustris]MDF3808919.1 HAD-IA family hydrolase [Rhodopseudomonas sp. BAL398]WOK18372.1 HAD-IA family hydrolase [Rhodopseudomonas sp. BAL398]